MENEQQHRGRVLICDNCVVVNTERLPRIASRTVWFGTKVVLVDTEFEDDKGLQLQPLPGFRWPVLFDIRFPAAVWL